jgi:hypothetical protein
MVSVYWYCNLPMSGGSPDVAGVSPLRPADPRPDPNEKGAENDYSKRTSKYKAEDAAMGSCAEAF